MENWSEGSARQERPKSVCAEWRAQLGFSKTQFSWAARPHSGGVACPHHPHVSLHAHETCFGQGNMNGGGECPFQEGAPKGQSSTFQSSLSQLRDTRGDADILKQWRLHQWGSLVMSKALPADCSGHMTGARITSVVLQGCSLLHHIWAYPDSHIKMKMYTDKQKNKERYQ